MNPRVLFIIGDDPRQSARPAEAIRIAAGVGAWKKAEITVYLRNAAVLLIDEYTDGLRDEDNFGRYLPIIKEWGRPVYVQENSSLLNELQNPILPIKKISDPELASLSTSHNYTFCF